MSGQMKLSTSLSSQNFDVFSLCRCLHFLWDWGEKKGLNKSTDAEAHPHPLTDIISLHQILCHQDNKWEQTQKKNHRTVFVLVIIFLLTSTCNLAITLLHITPVYSLRSRQELAEDGMLSQRKTWLHLEREIDCERGKDEWER